MFEQAEANAFIREQFRDALHREPAQPRKSTSMAPRRPRGPEPGEPV